MKKKTQQKKGADDSDEYITDADIKEFNRIIREKCNRFTKKEKITQSQKNKNGENRKFDLVKCHLGRAKTRTPKFWMRDSSTKRLSSLSRLLLRQETVPWGLTTVERSNCQRRRR